jgi:hypothetical protein
MGKQGLVGSGIIYADGYHSAKLGLPRTANPQMVGEPAASHWLQGWDDGNASCYQIEAQPAHPKRPSL